MYVYTDVYWVYIIITIHALYVPHRCMYKVTASYIQY